MCALKRHPVIKLLHLDIMLPEIFWNPSRNIIMLRKITKNYPMSATRYKRPHGDIFICIEMARERNQVIKKNTRYIHYKLWTYDQRTVESTHCFWNDTSNVPLLDFFLFMNFAFIPSITTLIFMTFPSSSVTTIERKVLRNTQTIINV